MRGGFYATVFSTPLWGLRVAAGWAPSRWACVRTDASQEKFVHDFIAVWDKVMNLDRFDLD